MPVHLPFSSGPCKRYRHGQLDPGACFAVSNDPSDDLNEDKNVDEDLQASTVGGWEVVHLL